MPVVGQININNFFSILTYCSKNLIIRFCLSYGLTPPSPITAGKVFRIYMYICTHKLPIIIYYKPIGIYMSCLTYLYKSMENQ